MSWMRSSGSRCHGAPATSSDVVHQHIATHSVDRVSKIKWDGTEGRCRMHF